MRSERPIRILAGNRSQGRCRDCKQLIVWVTTAPHGKRMPFDREPLILGLEQNAVTGVRFEVVAPSYNHFDSCRRVTA